MDERRNQDIPGEIRTENNPFNNRGTYSHQGNTLNEPVPFLSDYPRTNNNQSGYSNPNSNNFLMKDRI